VKEVNGVLSFSRRIDIGSTLVSEDGQTMAEYGVVLSVITLAIVTVYTALSGGIVGLLNRVTGILPS
jgi:Flp pilus assembly pilin Flp